MDAQTGKTASGTRHVHSNQEGELQPLVGAGANAAS